MNWTQEEWRRTLDLQTLDLQGRCIVYLFELSYIYTPFAIASNHEEESKSKPYKNNSVNNSDKNINNIFDPNE